MLALNDGGCDDLTGLVFSGSGGTTLTAAMSAGDDADYTVDVGPGMTFSPENLSIEVGETVEWVNLGGFHNVDGSTDTYPNNPASFYSGAASSDAWTYSFTFDVEGVYDYECNPHLDMNMVGTITVGDVGPVLSLIHI